MPGSNFIDVAHDYQKAAIDHLFETPDTIWVASMGHGKSPSTLQVIKELLAAGEAQRAVIFAPLRVAQITWTDENEKWGFGLRVVSIAGLPPKKRAALLAGDWDVLVVNYEMANWLEDQGFVCDADTVAVFDEITRLKSPTSKRRKAVRRMTGNAGGRLGLTGSPYANGYLDYWGMVDSVYPEAWGKSFYTWRARHFRPVDPDGHMWRVLPGCDEMLDADYAARCFSVEAPVFSEPQPVFNPVTLPAAALREYRELEREMVAEFDGAEIMAMQASTLSIKLRQVAAGIVLDDMGDPVGVHTAKLDAVREIVEDSGENCLLFYQFRAEVDALRAIWPDMPVLGGGTSAKDARRALEDWNAGKVRVMAAHPMSASHGLNLQAGGRRIIWLSLPWSNEQYEQAVARLARQGQKETVFVHHVTARDTIDDRMARTLAAKRNAQEALADLI